MKSKKIVSFIYHKNRLACIVSVLVFALMGMYVFYDMLHLQASRNKWMPLERMGAGWWYYASETVSEEKDPEDEYIRKTFEVLDTKLVNSFNGFDVFSCSEEAWDMFGYKLKKGDNFSLVEENEVILSRDMESAHPIGSTMEVKIYDKDSYYGKPDPVKTLECRVVGIMSQDEILFRQPVGSPTLSHIVSQSMFWKGEYGEWESALQIRHCFLNPRIEIENPKWYRKSSGIFFKAGDEEVQKLEGMFSGCGAVYRTEDFVKEEASFYGRMGTEEWIRGLAITLTGIAYFVVWLYFIFSKSKRDFAYLMYINGDLQGKERKRKNQSYYNKFYFVSFLCVPVAFLISFTAYFLPNEVESFWQMRPVMPLVVLVMLCVVWSIGIICLKIINRNYVKKVSDYLEDCDTKKLFMDELSVGDNLIFILTAKGFSHRWAADYTAGVLREHQLAHCKERRADMLSDGERMEIYEIREEFLQEK